MPHKRVSINHLLLFILLLGLPIFISAGLEDDETALRNLVNEFFVAFKNEDQKVFLLLWSVKSPELVSRKIGTPELFARHDGIAIKNLTIRDVIVDGEKARVLYEVEVTAIDVETKAPVPAFLAGWRALQAVKENGIWKIWRDGSLEQELAWKLLEANGNEERLALLQAEKELVTPKLSKTLVTLAERELYVSNNPGALKLYGLARQIAEQTGDKEALAGVLLGLGFIHRSQGNFDAALENFKKSQPLYQEVGNTEYVAFVLDVIGTIYKEQGDYPQALNYCKQSLAIADAEGLQDVIETTTMSLGDIYFQGGNFHQALENYNKILPAFQKSQAKMGIAYTLTRIANVYFMQGNYRKALNSYQQSLSLLESISDRSGMTPLLNDMGLVHVQQGNYDLALQYYQRSLALCEELGKKKGIADALNSIGEVYGQQGSQRMALDSYRRSLTIQEENGHKPGAVASLHGLGVTNKSLGNYDDALNFYQRSLALSKTMGSKHWIARTLIRISEVCILQRNYAGAVEYAEKAAEIASEIGLREALWESRAIAGKAYQALHQSEQARKALQEAITTIEDLRSQIAGGEQDRQRFLERKASPYYQMIELLISQNKVVEAFSFAERAKARVLLDVLQTGKIDIDGTMTDQEREKDQQLKMELVSLNVQILNKNQRPQPDRKRLVFLEKHLHDARLAYEGFITQLYTAHPELKSQRGESRIVTLDEIPQLLSGPDGILLEYVVAENKTYLFVLTANGERVDLQVHSIDIQEKDLVKRVEEFRNILAVRDPGFVKPARNLYDLLLGPAMAKLQGKSSIVIVPDSVLWEMPFQALQSSSGRYLVEDIAISYGHSITVLREMFHLQTARSPGKNSLPRLLAFGNPEFKVVRKNSKLKLRGENLNPLPEAEREVRLLGQLYGVERSTVYIGDQASEDRMKKEVGESDVLHLATHGIVSNSSPMYSHLLLAKSQHGAQEDGLLEAWEIMKLKIRSDLVVLSACETALGKIGAGEGMIGLTWSLFVAGSPATVVSQWKIDSQSTSELMLEFHRNLRSLGMTKAKALQMAAIKLRRTSQYSHPFYWAGFVLIGPGHNPHR